MNENIEVMSKLRRIDDQLIFLKSLNSRNWNVKVEERIEMLERLR